MPILAAVTSRPSRIGPAHFCHCTARRRSSIATVSLPTAISSDGFIIYSWSGRGGGEAAPAHFFSVVARGEAARHNRKHTRTYAVRALPQAKRRLCAAE